MTNQSFYSRMQSSMVMKKTKLYALFFSSLLIAFAPVGLGFLKLPVLPLVMEGVLAVALLVLAFATATPARSFYFWGVALLGAVVAVCFTGVAVAGDWGGAWFIAAISGISARISLNSLNWLRPDYGQGQIK